MEKPENNENFPHEHNDSNRCKIKLEKFHLNICQNCGAIKESFIGGEISHTKLSRVRVTSVNNKIWI